MSAHKDKRQYRNKQSGKYSRQALKTESNRIKKWKKHLKIHPNYIKGIDKMKVALGI